MNRVKGDGATSYLPSKDIGREMKDPIKNLYHTPFTGGCRPPSLRKGVVSRMLEAGATARVESNVGRTFSAGKVLALGVAGLGGKKTGSVYLYFSVDNVDIEMAKIQRQNDGLARRWAIEFNKVVTSRKLNHS